MQEKYNGLSKPSYGKVLSFDGESGKVIDEKGKTYAFNKNDVKEKISKGDMVYFRINHIPFAGDIIEVAKFLKKL